MAPGAHGVRRVASGPLAGPAAAAAGVVAGLGVIAGVNPVETHWLPCPLLSLTGLACPFCGGLRAAYLLAHGDVVGAADYHVGVLLGTPIVVMMWVRWVVRRARGSELAPFATPPHWLPLVAGLVLLVFAVVRNLPAGAWLAP